MTTLPPAPSSVTLTRELLDRQQDLTAASRFSRWHDEQDEPPRVRAYRDLIPLTAPRPGEQYAFEVDLDRCSGCKACVSACHALNGLDDEEAWRDTGLLIGTDWKNPFQQIVTTACHHCVEPGCLEGCPVLAYDKDPVTGIVRHLDDQCIGCQYCIMKCPYDVPKYSPQRGIVRKCDLCTGRLAASEAPACAQACPNEAIRVVIANQGAVREQHDLETLRLRAMEGSGDAKRGIPNSFLPASPDPRITFPTTRYRSARGLPDGLRAADREKVKPEPSHWPLVFMLVLTQLAAGLHAAGAIVCLWGESAVGTGFYRTQAALAWLALAAGLSISALHLGRPWGAWRSFLGLRTSWLSREIAALSLFGVCAAGSVAAAWLQPGLNPFLELASAFAGAFGVFCSAMVYADTKRAYWRLSTSAAKFFGTVWLLGVISTLCVLLLSGASHGLAILFASVAALGGGFKLAVDHRVLAHLAVDDFSPLHKTALLLTDRLGRQNRLRVACTLSGGVVLPVLLGLLLLGNAAALTHGVLVIGAGTGLALCLAGEIIERQLFFAAVQPVRMPGSLSS